jgi:hypothetical protein
MVRVGSTSSRFNDRMVGAMVIILGVWAVSVAAYLRIGGPARTRRGRDWRFAPILAMGFAIPLGAAYGLADWPGFTSLLVACVAAFAVVAWLLRPIRA